MADTTEFRNSIHPDGTWEWEGKIYKQIKCPRCTEPIRYGYGSVKLETDLREFHRLSIQDQIKYPDAIHLFRLIEARCYWCGFKWAIEEMVWNSPCWDRPGIEVTRNEQEAS